MSNENEFLKVRREDTLLRRYMVSPRYVKDDGTLSSNIFSKVKKDHPGISVDNKRLTNYDKAVLSERKKYRLCGITASIPIDLGLEVYSDPLKDNEAHVMIKGNLTKGIKRKLAKSAKLLSEEDW